MSPIRAVTVPRWGMTMTEGTICDWMASEGDAVVSGQELIEIETTKITNVVEAPGEGILRRVVLAKGTTAPERPAGRSPAARRKTSSTPSLPPRWRCGATRPAPAPCRAAPT